MTQELTPYNEMNLPSVQQKNTAMAIEQSRAVSETQAAMVVAQKFPRNENMAYDKILTACKRPSLASTAMYAYKRGTSFVQGPSIRLAEVMARCWGNMNYGFREISRTSSSSEIEAFCWDLETNTKATRTFAVKHWRDTKAGGYEVKQERDKYELVANYAQRRVRACILEMIPGDIVEAAENQCKKTIAGASDRPIEDRVRDMLVAFKEFGVDDKMIENFFNHKIKAIVPAELVKLQQIYKSLQDCIATREEFFDIEKPNSTNDILSGKSDKKTKKKSEKKQELNFDKMKELSQNAFEMVEKELGLPKTQDDFDKFQVRFDEITA